MVCSVYQWSAESTKLIESQKICFENANGLLSLPMVCWVYKINWTTKICLENPHGLLSLPMVCWVYKTEWTTKNKSWISWWSAESTNGLLSLQNWLNHKKYALKISMVCSVYQWSAESTKVIGPLWMRDNVFDGLLCLQMVCLVYKNHNPKKKNNGLLSLQMVCQTTQKSTSVVLRSRRKMVCVDCLKMVCCFTFAESFTLPWARE